MIKFAYTIHYVKDVEKTVKFYEEAFGLIRKFVTPENDYAELVTGETTLSFASIQLASSNFTEGFQTSDSNQKPFGIEIGFTTDNVQAALDQAVKAGAIIIEAPKTKPWGQVVAYMRDINGFLVEVCTEMN
jgi:lactoylglutathione lyase